MNNLFLHLKELEVNASKWHLETTSYAQHKCFENLYDSLNSLTDSIIEEIQGKQNKRISVNDKTIKLYPIGDASNVLSKVEALLILESTLYGKDIENTILTVLELIQKTKYLLTLS